MIDDIIIGKAGQEVTLKAVGRGVYWYNKIDGLATPVYRNTNVVAVGRDGGYTPKQLYGQRVITIEGGLRDCPNFMQAREALIQALSFDEDVPLKIKRTDGKIYQLMGKFDQPEMPIDEFFLNEFQLIFLSSNIFFSDVTGGSENTVDVLAQVAGGWKIYPEGWKIYPEGWKIYPAQDGAIAQNNGTTVVYPTIYIYGAAQNPVITNRTTGEQIKVNVTLGASDVIEINTELKSTMLNGGNINALVEPGSVYFGLVPGNNDISYSSDTNGYINIVWYDKYRTL
jgi:hypothetical protein